MGLFSKKKDWNVIAIMFETKSRYRVNGNRRKGGAAETVRDGARNHQRTLVWAVFDQKGAFLEGEWGAGRELIPRVTLKQLLRELPKIRTVLDVLSVLEKGETDQLAKVLHWPGYPIQNEQT